MAHLTLRTVSVVLIGRFDVRSFTPMSLLKAEVMSLSDATSAHSATILPNKVTNFELDGLKVSTTGERIQVEASEPPYVKAADLLSKAIRDNTDFPSSIRALGINVHAYYALDNFDVRDNLGRQLAPLQGWGKWSEQLKEAAAFPANDPRHSGMVGITMRLPLTEDRMSGYLDLRVEPSFRDKSVAEVLMTSNDHYGLPLDEAKAATTDELALLEALEARFDSSVQRADEIMSSILEQAK